MARLTATRVALGCARAAGDDDAWVSSLKRLDEEQQQKTFDLSWGPLWEVQLISRSETQHALLLTMSHLISDGWSTEPFMHERWSPAKVALTILPYATQGAVGGGVSARVLEEAAPAPGFFLPEETLFVSTAAPGFGLKLCYNEHTVSASDAHHLLELFLSELMEIG